MWNFCRKVQFPHSFGRFARNSVETVTFHKVSTLGHKVKLQYFEERRLLFFRLLGWSALIKLYSSSPNVLLLAYIEESKYVSDLHWQMKKRNKGIISSFYALLSVMQCENNKRKKFRKKEWNKIYKLKKT